MLFDVFNGAPPGRNLERCRRAAATTKVLVDFGLANACSNGGRGLGEMHYRTMTKWDATGFQRSL